MRTKSCRHDAISMPSAEKVPGTFGTITLRDEDLARDRDRVQRPGAAEGDHRGVARIDALVDRHRAHRERHGGVGDLHDAERRFRARASRSGSPIFVVDRALGGGAIELHGAVEEALGVDAAEDEVGVGHDRIESSPCRSRPDPDRRPRSAARHGCRRSASTPGDRAAAGADLDDVDDRQAASAGRDASPPMT